MSDTPIRHAYMLCCTEIGREHLNILVSRLTNLAGRACAAGMLGLE